MIRRPLAALLSVVAAGAVLAPPPSGAAALTGVTARWDRRLPGAWLNTSSPVIADVNADGSNDVVVGGLDGKVYALDAAGNALPGWPAAATAPVASSPAVGDVDGDGRNEVVVGVGDFSSPQVGGLNIFDSNGARRCSLVTNTRATTAVFNSPAIGDVDGDGRNEIVFGSFDAGIRVADGRCGVMAYFDNKDTVFSAPALYDVDGDGASEIFIGGDATQNPDVPGDSHNGGIFRSFRYQAGRLIERWNRTSTETFQSAASVGDVNGDGRLEVVTGAGAFYCRYRGQCADSNKVWAFHLDNGTNTPGWPKTSTFNTTFLSAPALGDIDGDGGTDVVIGTNHYLNQNPAGGALDAFYSNGSRRTFVARNEIEILSSPVIADVNGTGNPEVVVGAEAQIVVLDQALQPLDGGLAPGLNHKSSAAIGKLGTKWALVTSSFEGPPARDGRLHTFDIPTPRSTPWPMHRKNPARLGADAVVALPIECNGGYRLVASDGGIFSFGNADFLGSTGAIRLNQPIVAMANAPKGNGYWFVARDGGIFSFGDAKFFGSTGAIRLNQPIVGMAPTPTGQGYWLVASDGGIFSFGDAKFFGSTGAIRLNQPIVGMAPTPTGQGYWLVASDGGIFSFGDAKFFGSTGAIRLNSPIVGMAATPSGQGYSFVARDGGIFTFGNAKFFGSAGNLALTRPVVAMQMTRSGNGYWFVADDGGIFSFGDAEFCGSTARQRLNFPIVGMA